LRYIYRIEDGRGAVIHGSIPSREQADEIMQMMSSQGVDVQDYVIIEETYYTVTGLGRDPDLH
tara:strand:+ start:115 stop:303 length:189 start_codon:yes stop_codon:yes gene_type:complete